MENPKHVQRALITMIMTSGIGCIGLSLYLWDTRPVIIWGVFLAGSAMAFAMATVLYGATIWPVLLFIGYIFDRPSKTVPPPAAPAEPRASADRGQRRGDPTRSARGG